MADSLNEDPGTVIIKANIFVVLEEFDTQTLLALHMKWEVALMSDSPGENRILVAEKLRKWKALVTGFVKARDKKKC